MYVLKISEIFCFIIQQELAKTSNVALNHYNEIHFLENTSKRLSKAMFIADNKKCIMLSSYFTK